MNFRIKKRVQKGGKVQGPSHKEGGVPVVTAQGSPATEPESGAPYEIEGGERVFSVEDTTEIERMVRVLNKAKGQGADKVAAKLGHFVHQAVNRQDSLEDEALAMGASAGNVSDVEINEYIN